MINHVFKGCLINWKLDNEEEFKRVSAPLGQIVEVDNTK